jgi:hypothetical protein
LRSPAERDNPLEIFQAQSFLDDNTRKDQRAHSSHLFACSVDTQSLSLSSQLESSNRSNRRSMQSPFTAPGDAADPTQGGHEASGSNVALTSMQGMPAMPALPPLVASDYSGDSPAPRDHGDDEDEDGESLPPAKKAKRASKVTAAKGKGRADRPAPDLETNAGSEDEGEEAESTRGESPQLSNRPKKVDRRFRKAKVTKRDTIMPEMPTLFRDKATDSGDRSSAAEDPDLQHRRIAELARARDP